MTNVCTCNIHIDMFTKDPNVMTPTSRGRRKGHHLVRHNTTRCTYGACNDENTSLTQPDNQPVSQFITRSIN